MDLAIEVDYAVVRSVEVDYNSVVEYDLLLAGKVKAVADCPKKAHVGVVHQLLACLGGLQSICVWHYRNAY